MSIPRLTFTVWTDVLCPWCYNVSVCLDRLRDELRGSVDLELVWKGVLLRPVAEPKTLERFRRYTESWMRPAGQEDCGEFRVWASGEDPPSHSVPPAVAVRAAARQGAIEPYRLALMHAYFAESRNVTARPAQLEVAERCALDLRAFERDLDDIALVHEVASEHNESVQLGITGVPCVVVGDGFQLPGSQDRSVYRNIVGRLVARHIAHQEQP